ncbi:MAG TPA: biopolymer transporter ExbD [Gemmatimonadota bacterium]|jgi:biopolymer transport protein ExbD
MAFGRTGKEMTAMADINVTALVDVMIVLLVIFMITAPMMTGGVDVRLPQAQTAPLEQTEALVVTVNAEGRIFIDEAEVQPGALGQVLKQMATSRGTQRVYFRADERAPWGSAAKALADIRNVGIENVGVVLEPEPEGKR